MSLRSDAIDLLGTLRRTVEALEAFEHPNGSSYASDMAARLAPAVDELERAVLEARSRDAAAEALNEIAALMDNLNGAATKSGLDFFAGYGDDTLNEYWRLNTIFRETKNAHESL